MPLQSYVTITLPQQKFQKQTQKCPKKELAQAARDE
jgi:phage-related protein